MRDDLHHSLPLTSPWRAAVRAASGPDLNGSLADAMTRAAWSSSTQWLPTPWGSAFTALLDGGQRDLFGLERIERSLNELERVAPDHFARRACEIAHAMLMNGEQGQVSSTQVIRATIEAGIENGIEHVFASIERTRPGHGGEVLRRMNAALQNCDLSRRPAPKRRARKPTVQEGLGINLTVMF